MKNYFRRLLSVIIFLTIAFFSLGQKPAFIFTVSVPEPAKQYYHVELRCEGLASDSIVLKMPNWTPGYYQLMNYADKVSNFKAFNQSGPLNWQKTNATSWKIDAKKGQPFSVSYDVKATHNFVAGNFVNEDRAYLSPA